MKLPKMIKHIGQAFASIVVLLTTMALLAVNARAASGSWTNEAGGNWSGIANWDPNAAPGIVAGDVVSITNNIQDTNVTHTITVDTPVTLGTLNIGDSDAQTNISWTVTGGAITLNNSGSGAALNVIATSKGDTVSAPITLADNLTIANSSANTLSLSGVISGTGGVTVNSSGSGAFSFAYFNAANTFAGPVSILSGNTRLGAINSVGSGGVVTSGPLGKGNDITLANGVGIWGSNTDIAATNLFVLGNVNVGVATNLGTRLRFAGNLNLNGGTRIFRLSRIGTGLSSCTWGFTSVAGMVAVVTNGTISFQAHPDIVAAGKVAWVNMNQVAYFTNNSGMIIGQNVVCGGEPSQWLSTNPNSVPNVTIESGGMMDLANTVNSRSVTIASLSGNGGVVNSDTDGATTGGDTSTLTILGGGINASNGAVFSGVITNGSTGGKVAVTKQGNSTQSLLGANTYSGPTTVSAGKLVTSTLSSNGYYTVSAAATLGVKVAAASTSLKMNNFTNPSTTVLEVDLGTVGNSSTPVIFNSGNNHTASGTVTVNLLGSKSAMSVGTFTVLTNLSRTGTGKYVLGTVPSGVSATLADNTNSVEITISAINPLWVWSGTANANWDIGTSSNWLNDSLISIAYTEPALGVVFDDTATGATNVNITTTVSPPSVTLANTTAKNYAFSGSGKISGSTGVTKSGNGLVTMGTANDYSGTTLISAGTLKLGASNVIPDGVGKGNVTVDGTVDLAGYSETVNGLSGAGKVDASTGNSVLTVGAGDTTSSFTGSITNSAGVLALAKSGSGTFTLGGNGSYAGGTLISAGTLETTTGKLGSGKVTNNSVLSLSGSFTLTNDISGTGQVVKNGGADTLVFVSGINTHSGGTLVNSNSGTLLIDSASALGAGASVVVLNDSALRMSNNITVSGKTLSLAGSSGRGSLASATGSDNTWSGNITLTQDGARFNSRNTVELGTLRLPGVIDSGTNVYGINVRYGTVYFGGANTYLGGTTFAAGTGVLDGAHNRLPVTTTVSMGFGATVIGYLDLNGWNQEIAGLQLNASNTNGSPSSSVFNNTGTRSILTINAGTNATAYGGQIDGNIALIKTGTNSFRLNGVNSYTGTSTVNQGTLLIDGNNGSSAVTVNANGALGGLGTIGGNVTFNSGSHAVFTNGAALTINGSLNIATSGTIPDVHLHLPDSGLATGNYTLATYNTTGSSGSFAATPIVDSGSLNGNSATIVTGGGNVVLQVTAGGSPVLTNSFAGGVLTLSWPAGYNLEAQTNNLSTGLGTNWTPVTGATSPYNVTPNAANGAVFYRLSQ